MSKRRKSIKELNKMKTKIKKRTINDFKTIASEHQWRLNSDEEMVEKLLNSENLIFSKFGNFYCPCRIQHLEENICPCTKAQKEIDEQGHCLCMLFYAKS